MENLEGKVAVVTGAGSGIGAGIARAAAAAGMKVVVSDIDRERAQAVSDALPTESIALATDVSDLSSVEALAAASEEAFGAVHLLCNNAGVWVGSLMEKADIKDWQYLINVNLYGVIHGIKVFLPKMLARQEGHIVNTASMGGFIAGPPEGLYCTTKFATVGLSESLLMEVADRNIGVSVLCPGLVKTRLIELADEVRPAALQTQVKHDVVAPDVDAGLAPDEVGQRVMDAVKEGEFYIITHDDYKDVIKMRHDGILAAIEKHAERYG
ncbi:MAG: SDR family NAD(P)-dependent oxidoreductase [Pseudomonadota bacterium]